MPSLPLLASWAYTDLALAFYCAAVLYLLWLALDSTNGRPWILSGIFCGMAMGIKYTSFVLPLVALALLVWTSRRHLLDALAPTVRFTVAAVLVASPWYLRNWIWVGNPFYPFLFGGKYWDAFLAAHYAQSGTGIGFNLRELILMPLNLALGQRDANFYDGRIGPLWLILLPACLWLLWNHHKAKERRALYLPALFGAASLGVWVAGVINFSALWQSRLLFPALLPLAPMAALAWESFSRFDTRRFQFSFFFSTLVVLSIMVSLLDFGLFVLARDPLAAALGMTSRQAYFEYTQPSYADALSLVSQTPADAHIYFLFEPRSYGMNRTITPDSINQNLVHDFYLYHTPENILHAWQSQRYNYVLYQRVGDGFPENLEGEQRLFSLLDITAETPNTILYRIPSP
jgi:4-amino-4-deoxy-L-arabinose transferase-like glycosyltransferase